MHCDDAARALQAGEAPAGLDIHLSACESCRLLSEDLAEMAEAFSAARASWAPGPDFQVRIPSVPWRRLAIAASLLLLPLAGWALASLQAPAPGTPVTALLDDPVSLRPLSDRELLGALFLEDASR